MPWIAAGGAILQGIGKAGAAKKAEKRDFKNTWNLNEQEGTIGRQNSQFSMALEKYYADLDKQEKMRGLDEFRKFSTVSQFAPNYQNTMPAPTAPVMPVFNQGVYAASKPVAAAK